MCKLKVVIYTNAHHSTCSLLITFICSIFDYVTGPNDDSDKITHLQDAQSWDIDYTYYEDNKSKDILSPLSFSKNNVKMQTSTEKNNKDDTKNTINIGTQTESFEDESNIREANIEFGRFVARELANVPRIKRRQVMWQIIQFFEHISI